MLHLGIDIGTTKVSAAIAAEDMSFHAAAAADHNAAVPREEGFFDAWTALEEKIAKHSVKEVCEEAAYTWFNRLVAIRIMQKNGFIEPVMAYTNEVTRIPVIVDEARTGRLGLCNRDMLRWAFRKELPQWNASAR